MKAIKEFFHDIRDFLRETYQEYFPFLAFRQPKETYDINDWEAFRIDHYGVLITLIEKSWYHFDQTQKNGYMVARYDKQHIDHITKQLRTELDRYLKHEREYRNAQR